MKKYEECQDDELIRRLRDGDVSVMDYLMEKYDTAWGQDTTRSFIMENDELMDGYRPNPLDSAS